MLTFSKVNINALEAALAKSNFKIKKNKTSLRSLKLKNKISNAFRVADREEALRTCGELFKFETRLGSQNSYNLNCKKFNFLNEEFEVDSRASYLSLGGQRKFFRSSGYTPEEAERAGLSVFKIDRMNAINDVLRTSFKKLNVPHHMLVKMVANKSLAPIEVHLDFSSFSLSKRDKFFFFKNVAQWEQILNEDLGLEVFGLTNVRRFIKLNLKFYKTKKEGTSVLFYLKKKQQRVVARQTTKKALKRVGAVKSARKAKVTLPNLAKQLAKQEKEAERLQKIEARRARRAAVLEDRFLADLPAGISAERKNELRAHLFNALAALKAKRLGQALFIAHIAVNGYILKKKISVKKFLSDKSSVKLDDYEIDDVIAFTFRQTKRRRRVYERTPSPCRALVECCTQSTNINGQDKGIQSIPYLKSSMRRAFNNLRLSLRKIQVLPRNLDICHQGGEPHDVAPSSDSNVTVNEQTIQVSQSSTEKVDVVLPVTYESLVDGGREAQLISELMSRVQILKVGTWSSNDTQSKELECLWLPGALCTSSYFKTSPNMAALDRFIYWHFDMNIIIQVNSNMYQTGQLIASWNYDFSQGSHGLKYLNDFIQAPHALITSPSNNVVEIKIPYKYKYAYLPRSAIKEKDSKAYVRLQLNVLNPLATSETVENKCSYVISCYLTNVRLTGLLSPGVDHQMFSMGVRAVEAMLHSVARDLNRDNPSDPTPAPAVVPSTSHSWCHGTNTVEKLNILRLDPLATTPHVNSSDEMTVKYITRKYGFLATKTWSTDNNAGVMILSFGVSPLSLIDNITCVPEDTKHFTLARYGSTPLGVISSMFAYWRGSLEYRFDFVSSLFHRGRVLVCFAPGYSGDKLTLEQASQTYHEIFDLQEVTSFTFTVPYIHHRTWMNAVHHDRTVRQNTFRITGQVVMFALNPLICIAAVSKNVNINCYVRAGTDFEVAVPVNPVVNTFYKSTYLNYDKRITVDAGYFPCYTSWDRNIRKKDGAYYLVIRYGAGTDSLCYVSGMELNRMYKSDQSMLAYSKTEILYKLYYICRIPVTGYEKYTVLVLFENELTATKVVREKFSTAVLEKYALSWYKDSDWAWSNNTFFNDVTDVLVPKADHQGDERESNTILTTFGINSSLTSVDSYAESFNDLKTLCRRYQLYVDTAVGVGNGTILGQTIFSIPIIPGGLYLDLESYNAGYSSLEFLNRARSGVMGILADGFRFFRGGLRFKMVFSTLASSEDIIIGISHIPNECVMDMGQNKKISTKAFTTTGYSIHIQASRINNVLEFEIPYYINSDFGLLCKPLFARDEDVHHCTLGSLHLSLMSTVIAKHVDVGVQLYVAFADDMRFSEFQGFSPCYIPDTIPDRSMKMVAEPKLALPPPTLESLVLSSDEEVDHQMGMMDFVTNPLKQSVKEALSESATTAEERIKEIYPEAKETVTNDIRSMIGTLTDEAWTKVKDLFGQVSSLTTGFIDMAQSTIIVILSNIVHVIMNPGLKTYVVAIVAIIAAILPQFSGVTTKLVDYFNTLYGALLDAWTHLSEHNFMRTKLHAVVGIEFARRGYTLYQVVQFLRGKAPDYFTASAWAKAIGIDLGSRIVQKALIASALADHQGATPSGEVDMMALNGSFVALISSIFGYKYSNSTRAPNFVFYLITKLKDFSYTANGFTTFLTANLECIKYAFEWVVYNCTGYGWTYMLSDKSNQITKWCERVQNLTSPLNRSKVFSEPYLQRMVFKTATQASQLQVAVLTNKEQKLARHGMIVSGLITRIQKLQAELIEECLCPSARYEPWVIQLYGEPGIGKSMLTSELAYQLLEGINYKTYSEPIFYKSAGTEYWNGVGSQPVICYDDFLFARSGPLAEAQVSEFMQLKSCAPFNPSIAEMENKKKRINPLIVMVASNRCFWNDLTFVSDLNALHRRRSMLWEVKLVDQPKDMTTVDYMKQVKESYKKTGVANFDHLQFSYCADAQNENSFWSDFMSYRDFLKICVPNFIESHQIELLKYKQRLSAMDRLMPPSDFMEDDGDVDVEIAKFVGYSEQDIVDGSIPEFIRKARQEADVTRQTVMGITRVQADETLTVKSRSCDDADVVTNALKFSQYQARATMHFTRESSRVEFEHPMHNGSNLDEFDERSQVYHSLIDENDDRELDDFATLRLETETPDEFKCQHYYKFDPDYSEYNPTEKTFTNYDITTLTGVTMPMVCDGNCYMRHDTSKFKRRIWVDRKIMPGISAGLFIPEYNIPDVMWELVPGLQMRSVGVNFDAANLEAVSVWTRIKSSVASFVSFETFVKIIKWLGLVGLGISAVFGGQFLYSRYGPGGNSTPAPLTTTVDPWIPSEAQALIPSGDSGMNSRKLRNAMRSSRKLSNYIRAKFMKPGAQLGEEDSVSTLVNIVKKNSFKVFIEVNGKKEYYQHGVILNARNCITTKHFMEMCKYLISQKKGKVRVVILQQGNYINVNYQDIKWSLLPESSIAIMELPINSINMHRDIRKHIVDIRGLDFLHTDAIFFEYDGVEVTKIPLVFDVKADLEIRASNTAEAQTLDMTYEYGYAGPGKCGCVLIATKPVPKIIGIHVAGHSTKVGYAQAIVREMFDDIEDLRLYEMNDVDAQMYVPRVQLPSGVFVETTVSPLESVGIPSASQIVQSRMFDQVFKHETEPAVLSIKDTRVTIDPEIDPFTKAIQTHGNVPLPFDSDILDDCVRDLSDWLIVTSPPNFLNKVELLDNQTIFGGALGGSSINKLNLSSSEGYPLSLIRKNRSEEYSLFAQEKSRRGQKMDGKSWLFNYHETAEGLVLDRIHPLLEELIDFNTNLRRDGVVPPTIFVDTLKDCRVTFDKVAKGKTRMFSISPIEYTWSIKKYFGTFQAAYQENRISNGTAIGINTHGTEWTLLARHLLTRGKNILVGDYKAFGDTLERKVMYGAFMAIFAWYEHYFQSSAETCKIRHVMVEELFNVLHLAKNVLYRMACGIPSGFGLTVEINDLVNHLYMRYCWKIITKRSLSDYNRFTRLVTYGDDLIMAVEDDVPEYNFSSIQKVLAEYNITFTPASKDESVYTYLSLDEVTFLKSEFVRHPTRLTQFMAKLPLSSCLDTLNWQHKGNDARMILFENSRAALNALFGHGPEVYNYWRNKLQMWFRDAARRGVITRDDAFIHLKTWHEVDLEIYGDNN